MYKYIIFVFVLIFHLFPRTTFAAENFSANVQAEYVLNDSGITDVRYEIVLENNLSELFAKSFTLNLENIKPKNIRVYSEKEDYPFDEIDGENKIEIRIDFPDAVVGKGEKRRFFVEFGDESFSSKTGEVWEVLIPKISDENIFRSYSLSLSVPDSFGDRSYISPEPLKSTHKGDRTVYLFNKETIEDKGISAGFGKFQIFSFSLTYHLQNSKSKTEEHTIPLPPDTSLQKVFYQNMNPKPLDVRVDSDGNWLGVYKLKSGSRVDVVATGIVQIFATPREYLTPTIDQLNQNLKETKYWQINDEEIKNISNNLKSAKDVYEFVVNKLNYDYDRVHTNVERYGAKGALEHPDQAICTEFTDLFITLARAIGIPAREINGYAYTENPQVKPLSLVADVLHAWPEYWDVDRRTWIAVDPTWGSTTKGQDYFNKLDLRHFAFVIHGLDPEIPNSPGSYKLGDNPQKDIFVQFGQGYKEGLIQEIIKLEQNNNSSFLTNNIKVNVKNLSSFAIYNMQPEVMIDGKNSATEEIPVFPPFSVYELKVDIPFRFFAINSPEIVKIKVSDQEIVFDDIKIKSVIQSIILTLIIFALSLVLFRKINSRKKSMFNKI